MPSIIAIDLSDDVLSRDYRGSGECLAAIDAKNNVVALRYLNDWRASLDGAPQWIQALYREAYKDGWGSLPQAHDSKRLNAIAKAASACADCPTPPRRERYRPTELLSMARAYLAAEFDVQRRAYREQLTAELAPLGRVVRGMASATQFVIVAPTQN